MCRTFFSDVSRPMHAVDLHQPTEEQLAALAHFFTKFEFFRLAVTIQAQDVELDYVELVCNCVLKRIAEIASHTPLSRAVIIYEESERLEHKVMSRLAGNTLVGSTKTVPIELALMPKAASMPALEVADFVIHTAGAQARAHLAGKPIRKDFELVFQSVDKRLVAFIQIGNVSVVEGKNATS